MQNEVVLYARTVDQERIVLMPGTRRCLVGFRPLSRSVASISLCEVLVLVVRSILVRFLILSCYGFLVNQCFEV